MKRIIAAVLAVLLVLQILSVSVFAAPAENESPSFSEEQPDAGEQSDPEEQPEILSDDYFSYYRYYEKKESVADVFSVDAEEFRRDTLESVKFDGDAAVILPENSSLEFSVNIPREGLYPVGFCYYNTDRSDNDYSVSLMIDGAVPYQEAKNLVLPRAWTDDANGKFEKDEDGNDIRPTQFNKQTWVESYVYDKRGLYESPYSVYLKEGVHTVTVTAEREEIVLGKVLFGDKTPRLTYSDYAADAKTNHSDSITLQAENTVQKSSQVLYPTYDKTDSSVQPQSPSVTLLNTIGKSNWTRIGDSIVWKPDIVKAGWYAITLRVKQNENQGIPSYRVLRINGEIPFVEATRLAFPYKSGWYMQTLGGEEPYLFYLEPGWEISLSVTMGPISEILRKVNEYTLKMNDAYRRVIAITGTSPDPYRDYMLSTQLPTLEKELADLAKGLRKVSARFEEITKTKGSQASILDYIVSVLDDFAYDCNDIPERLNAFQGVLENLGSLILTISKQPLEIDYFVFSVPKEAPTKASNGFFDQAVFTFRAFLASFARDYQSESDRKNGKEILDAWVSVGRDQARIINGLIRNDFSQNHQIKVRLKIVNTGDTLIKASLAGKGPDVAMLAGVPLELAARGALVPLTDYDLSDIRSDVIDSIWNALSYRGDIYALPETLTYHVMFYRKDILEEYGIAVPKTWDDFYKAMEELQKNNLTVGIPEVDTANYGVSAGIPIYTMLLLQRGGTYYNSNLTKALFDTEEAFSAFNDWVNLHKLYSNNREFNFYSRFRTGEMPLAIQPYSVYNQIASAAPEIQGLWDIAPIPGTKNDNGEIVRTQAGTATGCYMLKSAEEKGKDKEAFTFMKWWVGADTQSAYARELEATLGVAARHIPASRQAMQSLGWTTAEKKVLSDSLNEVMLMPQIPGNYLLQRSLTTAFRSAVTGKNRPRRALTIANKEINDELARKREEFGIGSEGEN